MSDVVQAIVNELAQAWNAGDGTRYAAPFAEDGEQVNIFGMQLIGRAEIAQRHDHVFKTIFAGSTNTFEILRVQELAPGVLFAHISSAVLIPSGPMHGELRTIASLVLQQRSGRWEIVHFHNTRVMPEG